MNAMGFGKERIYLHLERCGITLSYRKGWKAENLRAGFNIPVLRPDCKSFRNTLNPSWRPERTTRGIVIKLTYKNIIEN